MSGEHEIRPGCIASKTRSCPSAGYIWEIDLLIRLSSRVVDKYSLVLGVAGVPYDGIAARVEERFAAVVPPNPVVLAIGGSENLENLALAARLAKPVLVNHDQVANVGVV
jgi:hypothetical protein